MSSTNFVINQLEANHNVNWNWKLPTYDGWSLVRSPFGQYFHSKLTRYIRFINITVWSDCLSSKYSPLTLVPKRSTTDVAKTMKNEVFMSSDVLRVSLKNENLAVKRLDFYTTSRFSLWRWRKKMIAVGRQRFIFTHLSAST